MLAISASLSFFPFVQACKKDLQEISWLFHRDALPRVPTLLSSFMKDAFPDPGHHAIYSTAGNDLFIQPKAHGSLANTHPIMKHRGLSNGPDNLTLDHASNNNI